MRRSTVRRLVVGAINPCRKVTSQFFIARAGGGLGACQSCEMVARREALQTQWQCDGNRIFCLACLAGVAGINNSSGCVRRHTANICLGEVCDQITTTISFGFDIQPLGKSTGRQSSQQTRDEGGNSRQSWPSTNFCPVYLWWFRLEACT